MAHRSCSVAFNYCESEKSSLVRLEGRASTGRDAGNTSLPQRATLGYRPAVRSPLMSPRHHPMGPAYMSPYRHTERPFAKDSRTC